MAWDATIVSSLAESHVVASASTAGSAAEIAASNKCEKYTDLPANYSFQPIALETLGSVSKSTPAFPGELGNSISLKSGDKRETLFLRQRLSVCMQRFNSLLLHQSFVDSTEEPD